MRNVLLICFGLIGVSLYLTEFAHAYTLAKSHDQGSSEEKEILPDERDENKIYSGEEDETRNENLEENEENLFSSTITPQKTNTDNDDYETDYDQQDKEIVDDEEKESQSNDHTNSDDANVIESKTDSDKDEEKAQSDVEDSKEIEYVNQNEHEHEHENEREFFTTFSRHKIDVACNDSNEHIKDEVEEETKNETNEVTFIVENDEEKTQNHESVVELPVQLNSNSIKILKRIFSTYE